MAHEITNLRRAFRWAPHLLSLLTAASLMGALVLFHGNHALISLTAFIILFPTTLIVILSRLWPEGTRFSRGTSRWRLGLYLVSGSIVLAAVVSLFLGLQYFGLPLGTTLLVAATLLLPLALFMGLLSAFISRGPLTYRELDAEESMLFVARIHWGIWLLPIALATLCLILLLGPFGITGKAVAAVTYLIVLPGVAVRSLNIFMNTEITITSRRFITVEGGIFRSIRSIELDEVRAVAVMQNLLGRLLSYGRLGIICSDGKMVKLVGVHDPVTLRSILDPAVPHLHPQPRSAELKPSLPGAKSGQTARTGPGSDSRGEPSPAGIAQKGRSEPVRAPVDDRKGAAPSPARGGPAARSQPEPGKVSGASDTGKPSVQNVNPSPVTTPAAPAPGRPVTASPKSTAASATTSKPGRKGTLLGVAGSWFGFGSGKQPAEVEKIRITSAPLGDRTPESTREETPQAAAMPANTGSRPEPMASPAAAGKAQTQTRADSAPKVPKPGGEAVTLEKGAKHQAESAGSQKTSASSRLLGRLGIGRFKA